MVVASELVTFDRASNEPSETKAVADVYCVPGRRIIWEVLPVAFRMAVTTVWTVLPQVVMSTWRC